jgi:hypothetical protein
MDKKILIFEDTGAKNQFIANCETTAAQANDLITVFQAYQDLKEIETIDEFYALVTDPILFYDETLRTGLSLQAAGNRTPDPETLAKLFSYDRPAYVATIRGLPITETCEGCRTKTIIRKSKKAALTEPRFTAYRSYLTFTPEGFILNEAEIEKHCERFKTFAENEQQIAVVDHYNALVTILNSHDAMFPLAPTDKELLTRIFGLHIEHPPYQGRFLINSEHLRNQIYK